MRVENSFRLTGINFFIQQYALYSSLKSFNKTLSLSDTEGTYFFASMNCATLSDSNLISSRSSFAFGDSVNCCCFNNLPNPSSTQLKIPLNSLDIIFLARCLSCFSSGIITSKFKIINLRK